MYYEKEINLLAQKSQILQEIKRDYAIKELRKKASNYKQESSTLKRKINYSNDLEDEDACFSTKKSENYIENEEKVFPIIKDKITFNIHLNKFWQKQFTVSNYEHVDTSYVKYEVYIQMNYDKIINDKYMLKTFLDEKKAETYFKNLKEKLVNTSTQKIFDEIIDCLDEKIIYYKDKYDLEQNDL